MMDADDFVPRHNCPIVFDPFSFVFTPGLLFIPFDCSYLKLLHSEDLVTVETDVEQEMEWNWVDK